MVGCDMNLNLLEFARHVNATENFQIYEKFYSSKQN